MVLNPPYQSFVLQNQLHFTPYNRHSELLLSGDREENQTGHLGWFSVHLQAGFEQFSVLVLMFGIKDAACLRALAKGGCFFPQMEGL